MPRTQKVLRSCDQRSGEIIDTLLLKFEDRVKRQGFVFGGKGTCIEFDFPDPPLLRTDDLLVLDDGHLVEVVADVQPVIEVREKDFAKAARLVLALGNRHVPVQVLANRLRLLPDPELTRFLRERGFQPTTVTAPFEPEDGSAHGHDHGHHHDDGHRDHDHGHHHDHEHHGHGHAHDHEHHGHEHHGHEHHGHEHHGHNHDHAHDGAHAHDQHDHDHGHRHGKT
jgi:urease accessory protein